jgi:hypothetical protein
MKPTREQKEVIDKCRKMLNLAFPALKGYIKFGLHPDRPNADEISVEYLVKG